MPLERIDVPGPELSERLEPLVDLLERAWQHAIDATLRVHPHLHEAGLAEHAEMLHEAGLAEHAEMLGHRRLRHPQTRLDLPHGPLLRGEQREDGPPVRLRDDRERRFHIKYILLHSYMTQAGSKARDE